ncbi:hypothetical protein TanjilG_26426 [Lupinus angustifolius]|uniref:Uncharacterized protein ycf33 n=1 Tax=Lupinus angustifolius TaxID=3871 RepID=A0A4P1R341_LUPAN|nr:PREDICTED: uncharacterized protein LOC109362737 [Lupinus angustifolius]OIW00089.1 hypothetical protein TanjilG_26426 [Lupinus angustifolius]
MMKNVSLRSELLLHFPTSSNPSCYTCNPPSFVKVQPIRALKQPLSKPHKKQSHTHNPVIVKQNEHSWRNRVVVIIGGAVCVGMMVFMNEEKALALGPEGPLVEEFWDNVRRYGLYALTVSTGAIYTILQPIWELLKNPISAILVILIFGGAFFIISQVISAMVGVTDFSYDYGY